MGAAKMKVITKTHIKEFEKLEERPVRTGNENERFVELDRVDSVHEVEFES